jgi:signal transduction histidine kinase
MRPVSGLPASPGRPDATTRRFDGAIVLGVVALAVVTAVVWLDPRIPTRILNPSLDIAINVAATLVGGTVAALAWVRWLETRRPTALFQTAAFTALSTTNALMTGLVITGHSDAFGLDAASPGAAPVYLWSATRLVAAVLLFYGGIRGVRGDAVRIPPPVVALGPTVVLVAGTVLFVLAGGVRSEAASAAVNLVQLGAFGAFIGAAFYFRRLYVRDRRASDAVLAAGSIVAAFSQLHFAFDPALAAGIVTSGDLLRVGFHGILLYGIQAEIQGELVAVRRANIELARLRDVDAASATLAERARLAREIHDGLAQTLWYAKLKQSRLTQDPALEGETRSTADEVLTAIEAALADARQAVMALRTPPAGSNLEEILRSYVDEFADRYGLRADFQAEGELPRLPPRTEAEVLRIVQEALNNVRKHADATVVRVRSSIEEGSIVMVVADNGRGFDPLAIGTAGFGLRGMRERADLISGSLSLDSRPGDGARVVVRFPVAPEGSA